MLIKNEKLKFTIFKLKNTIPEFKDYLEDNKTTSIHNLTENFNGIIAVGHNSEKIPKWLNYINSISKNEVTISNKSTRVIIILNSNNNHYAICFGYGKYLLKDDLIIRNFGLKIVLNTVNPDKLRSIDIINIKDVPFYTRKQPGKEITINDFELDYLSDLLKSITGTSSEDIFQQYITGRDSIHFNKDIEDLDLNQLCHDLELLYKKTNYKKHFSWVDNIFSIREKETIIKLDEKLITDLRKSKLDNIHLSPPDIIDFRNVGLKYTHHHGIETSMSIQHYLDEVKNKSLITIEKIKSNSVYAVDNSTGEIINSWSIYNSIFFETTINSKQYFLYSGEWFQASKSFIKQIDNELLKIKYSKIQLPPFKQDEHEGLYNMRVSNNRNIICLDRNNIMVGGSPVEPCDLFIDKKFIHIKHWVGSSTFSHLLSQGKISASLFLNDTNFRKKLKSNIGKLNKSNMD